ncbi:MAG TPA: hypothetical protein DD379_09465, partial [Cyanobacteria bacterium UBA11162]|nr:hypothetical protein [Cyanobacteria bacterium UBA11162]
RIYARGLITQPSNAQHLLQQGITLYESEQYSQAAAIWLQAASAFASQGNNLTQALVLSHLSLAYQHLGQWDEAENAIADSLTLLKNHDDSANTQLYLEILAKALNTQGRLQWATGQLEVAIETWQAATRTYLNAGNQEGVVISSINQAQALQALGLSRQAEEILQRVDQYLQQQPDTELQVTGWRHLGNGYRRVGKLNESLHVLTQSLDLALNPNAKRLALLELGNTERALGDRALAIGKEADAQTHTQAAIEYYQKAANISDVGAQLQPQLNQLSLWVGMGEWSKAAELYPQIEQSLKNLPPSRTTIYARLNFARSLTCLLPGLDIEALVCSSRDRQEQFHSKPEASTLETPSWQDIAQILATAVQEARTLQDKRAESYALGQLAGLYELKGQWSDAQELTQQALLRIEETKAPDIRYRWEWQLGRLLKKQGDIKSAIAGYTTAVQTLKSVRHNLLTINPDVQFSFRDNVEPLYRELVDLLLRTDGTSEPSQENLQRAIETIDSLQLAELENFLGCNLSLRVQLDQNIDKVDANAAFIYPIILDDRLDVIFKLPGQPLRHHANLVEPTVVENTLRGLRKALLRGNAGNVTEKSQVVYQWLIAPIEEQLQKSNEVETLVFVLDGDLRNIPMAALYDQKTDEYLIEKKYALVLLPSSQLFDLRPRSGHLQLLGAGISEGLHVENRRFLPLNITQELEQIAKTPSSKILLNSEFTKDNFQQTINSASFSIIHLATHGNFSSDPEETYILVHSTEEATGELFKARELDNLLRSTNQETSTPLELLVLSACKSAEGDNRATLGLAGLAVRAGASSTLATLWQVSDDSTVKLMKKFYSELNQPGVTKAEALHRAQQDILKEQKYQTPFYWASYVLVGNWL